MKSVVICLPAYDGKVSLQWMAAYVGTNNLLTQEGIKLDLVSICGCGLITAARNELLTLSLQTDADYILMIDSKQLWEPVGIMRMIRDIDEVGFVVAPAPTSKGAFHAHYTGETRGFLKEATHAAIAFSGIRRDVLEDVRAHYPELAYVDQNGNDNVALFHQMLQEDSFIGEDLAFSMRVRDAGYRIWVDEAIRVRRLM